MQRVPGTEESGYWQEIVFYLAYGVLLLLYSRRLRWSVEKWGQLLPLAAIDYLSNLAGQVGRGVGLCLVKDLAEQELGGSIRVEARDDRVSFTVAIPAAELEAAV